MVLERKLTKQILRLFLLCKTEASFQSMRKKVKSKFRIYFKRYVLAEFAYL